MAVWSMFGLQEGATVVIELINYFHDHIIMLLTIILVFVSYIFIIVLCSFKVDRNMIDSHLLEIVWTVVPIVFLLFMALPSLYLLYITEDLSGYTISIKVIGHQWYWEYEYYNRVSDVVFNSYMINSPTEGQFRLLDVDNRLALPYMLRTILIVTSADVLHSWAVPSLGVKTDAIPGRLNYLNITPSRYGVYYGQCSELCGTNHSFMPIVVEVRTVEGVYRHIKSLA